MSTEIQQFKKLIEESRNIVFFGGAGVSTESGIPDFRSVDGLYNQEWKYPPETIISRSFFEENPTEYFRFHRKKLALGGALPNTCHLKLAELERQGKLKAVITQNIDGLHQAAGSKNVLELHGSLLRAFCCTCGKAHDYRKTYDENTAVPRCECGGIIRPDIVLYEEQLDQQVLRTAVDAIRSCDVLIVGGTSLNVYPAAGLINYYRGSKLVLINLSTTPYDQYADLVIHEKIGQVFGLI